MKLRTPLLACTAMSLIAAAFDNTPGWKMDGDKLATDANGDPVYVDASGRENPIKHDAIAARNREAQGFREAKEKAETDLAKYRDESGKLIDPDAAKKAIDTVSKIDAKTLIDAGKVDELREQMRSEFTQQLTEKDGAISTLQSKVDNMTIDSIFKGSEFIADRLAVPRDMVEAALRPAFKIEDGKVTAYDKDGNRLMSKKSAGDYADPAEAIELLIDRHPQKDMILKAPEAGGSGSGGGGGNRGGGRTIRRSEFEALEPAKQGEIAAAAGKGEMTIVD